MGYGLLLFIEDQLIIGGTTAAIVWVAVWLARQEAREAASRVDEIAAPVRRAS